MTAVPLWVLFISITLLTIGMLEIGYRAGRRTHRRSPDEKESPVGAFAAAMLGLSAFMLGFTFNIAAERYQTSKQKVRQEVEAIQTAFLRAEFLPEPDRNESKKLIVAYVDEILASRPSRASLPTVLAHALSVGNEGHRRLWAIAAENGRKEHESNMLALYAESLNDVFSIHAERAMLDIPVVRIPIWASLVALTCLAVLGVAYQSGIAGSKRSKVGFLLAGSFALVMMLIADLDRVGGLILISYQPYQELRVTLTDMSRAAP